ncbi:Glu-tRNA(Gln) amidotransferase subunit GatE [Candidatus Woesearchaeota archaeon]|nr:Glu-tRNA(Gln) amidotransferase subunit GatE [Candidatus Woesearchaeota archaeon]
MTFTKLGLKCGIEIHQQLEGKKLFCHCPTRLRDDSPQFTLRRTLRAAAGESGVMDIAAVKEQQKGKIFIYEGYHDTTCLVETDSEPPHETNREALTTALQFCLLVNANVTDVIQMMRKTIVDGSNTSGFQRTGLIGRNGLIETKQGKVNITNVSLEEDSCKIINDTPDARTYRLDRLGIPLIEVGTAPDITSPEQCQEVAKHLGMLLRSLPGVKRGLGTIRQDVNVSIKGGSRVEIKGAQDLRLLPLLVEYEAKRQEELLKLKEEIKKIKLTQFKIIELTHLFQNSTSKIIASALQKKNGKVLGIRLNQFSGLLGKELLPKHRVGTELAGRARILAGVGGIIHSDEFDQEKKTSTKYALSSETIDKIEKALSVAGGDAYVLVADEEQNARKALEAVYRRVEELFVGVPTEVRKANDDGTTSYLRPMPGAARMYPETDVPLIYPSLKGISLPELLPEKIERYQRDLGLAADLAEYVAKSDKVTLFEEIVKHYPAIKPAFVADVLVSFPIEIRRKYGLDPELLSEEQLREFFRALSRDQIHKDIALDVLIDMIKGTYDVKRYASLGTEEIHAVIREVLEKNKGAPFSALMGLCMKRLAGKASGEFISKHLKKLLEDGHQ